VQHSEKTSNPEGIARRCPLPNDEFSPAWTSIKLAAGVHDRLLAQSLLSFTVRQKLAFEVAPLHGLILLTGAPGTGKTTLGRGLANQIARQLSGAKCTYVEVNPHALTSSALGRSQQAVAKLFEQTIPELAMHGAVIALLDEVETLAVSRHQDANGFSSTTSLRMPSHSFDSTKRNWLLRMKNLELFRCNRPLMTISHMQASAGEW
jgi:SpoVK/Ycf46/Vps4 family AAA+-type ATPase